jgi:hypothetical protein
MVNEPRIQQALNALDQAKDLTYQKHYEASQKLNSFMHVCRISGLNPIKVLEEHYTKQRHEPEKFVQPVIMGDNPNTGNYVCKCGKLFSSQNALNGHKKGCKS